VYDYIRSPEAIYRRSFELIAAESDFSRLPAELHDIATRLVHACGMPDIVDDLRWGSDPAGSGWTALSDGAPVLADCRMLADGIIPNRLPKQNPVICTLSQVPRVNADSGKAMTRSAAAVERWLPHLDGAVVAIGNAPTALFRLLELLLEGAPRPAALFAFPVGFVGAAESKQALVDAGLRIPFITLRGRRGGSAIAAAAINALATGRTP
jgi:precorrin-8X/cobalt-precorrin-8 methylmutase